MAKFSLNSTFLYLICYLVLYLVFISCWTFSAFLYFILLPGDCYFFSCNSFVWGRNFSQRIFSFGQIIRLWCHLPLPQHDCLQDLFFLGPKSSKTLLFPSRESATHNFLHIVLLFNLSENRNLSLREFDRRALSLQILETRG